MVYVLGIDEAGRGPLLGPLVIAGVIIRESEADKLGDLGVKDSKMLTPLQRERIAKNLRSFVKYKVIKISPKEIDDAVEGDNTNLNWLEADNTIKIINELNPNKAYIDCPSTNVLAYKNYLKNKIEKDVELYVGHKMDSENIVCAAASVIAKVERDSEIEKIKKKTGYDFNSGYPSDHITQEFLKKHYKDFPDIFRKSWSSYKKLIGEKTQKKLGNFR